MLSPTMRRRGARTTTITIAALASALVVAFASSAFASSASVRVRIEGGSGTLYDSVQSVAGAPFTDSSGASFDPSSNPTPVAALALAARLGGYPFSVTDYGSMGLLVDSFDGAGFAAPDFNYWHLRINGSETAPGTDSYYGGSTARLHNGDEALWYYGSDSMAPANALLPVKAAVGSTMTIVARQLDVNGKASALPTATVHVGSLLATSAADGVAQFRFAAPGDFGVRVEKPGFVRSGVETLKVRYPTAFVSFSANKTRVKRGTKVTLSGHFVATGASVAGLKVNVYRRLSGGARSLVGRVTLGSSGKFSVSTHANVTRNFYAVFDGDSRFAGASSTNRSVVVR